MGFYPLWSPPLIYPRPLADDVLKRHLPIHSPDLVILRLCFGDQLLVRDCNSGRCDYLPLALWEGIGSFL